MYLCEARVFLFPSTKPICHNGRNLYFQIERQSSKSGMTIENKEVVSQSYSVLRGIVLKWRVGPWCSQCLDSGKSPPQSRQSKEPQGEHHQCSPSLYLIEMYCILLECFWEDQLSFNSIYFWLINNSYLIYMFPGPLWLY